MKIVTKDNFDRDIFKEDIVAENVNEYFGEELVKEWNNKHWNEYSNIYLKLVADGYELYDGYADLM